MHLARSSYCNPYEPEKAQIAVEGADHLTAKSNRNTFQDEQGNDLTLTAGAEVDVAVEAPAPLRLRKMLRRMPRKAKPQAQWDPLSGAALAGNHPVSAGKAPSHWRNCHDTRCRRNDLQALREIASK
jgi:hypothetical protein